MLEPQPRPEPASGVAPAGPTGTDGPADAPPGIPGDEAETEPSAGAAGPGPTTASLPGPVRARVLEWAAAWLSARPVTEIPAGLARVARFTPAKRARLGAVALASALDGDPAFRAAVAQSAAGSTDTDAAAAAALAHLLRLPEAEELVAAFRPASPAGQAVVASRVAERRIARLERQVTELRDERDALRRALADGGETEAQRLRQRLREQGVRLRAAEDAAARAGADAHERMAALTQELEAVRRERADWERRAQAAGERADRAQQSLTEARQAAGWSRGAADRRLDLLLQTVEGAAMGLRRELALQGGGPDPADVRAARSAPPRGEATGDPAVLQSWLVLPGAHLLVDGYNVTKTGYPELSLAQQRDRLVRTLAASSARTGADVTVVFDGAAVVVPQPPGRGIRVLFSPPGVLADDVVRDLVAAEPPGRVVVVVSSDGQVERGARARGARTAPSRALLALLGG
ncbi:NYN domain-containing protein [Nakamurella endophytica]|uniref:RNA-binding protein n=1 Tax=Nakamurella endophytica TaxID=1748367 RepID=A0A917T686_9ACTN|nr:NYN domain-containing protein [Nakamurella endophytica]GGM12669.1 RNA-binding protein [Nakamurella endophytica]